MTAPTDAQRLAWLQAAASAISRGHRITADELLSDMVVSLGERGLEPIQNKGNAWQLARWRKADWCRRQGRPEPVDPEPEAVEVPESEDDSPPMDLGGLAVWRRRLERERSRELGRPVRLSDRRAKEMLRARAKRLAAKEPEAGLELLAIASEPGVSANRGGRRG